jgi:hypothetical protein
MVDTFRSNLIGQELAAVDTPRWTSISTRWSTT